MYSKKNLSNIKDDNNYTPYFGSKTKSNKINITQEIRFNHNHGGFTKDEKLSFKIANEGEEETVPKNISLLICIKY